MIRSRFQVSACRGGFTLVEAVAVLSIMGLIMIALSGVLHTTAQGAKRAREILRQDRLVVGVGRLLRRDLGGAVNLYEKETPPLAGGFRRGNDAVLSVLTTHTVRPEGPVSPSGFYWAEYFLEPESDDRQTWRLVRRETPYAFAPVAAADGEAGEWLAAGIVNWRVGFNDGTEWVDEWQRRNLPLAVRLEMTLPGESVGMNAPHVLVFAPQVRPGSDPLPQAPAD